MSPLPGFLTGIASPFTGVNDSLLASLDHDDRERTAAIGRAWRYYEGDVPRQLRVNPGQPDDNVRSNPVAMFVDGFTSYLFGEHLDLALRTEDPADERQVYLDEVWDANDRMGLLGDLRTNGGIAGHAFVKLVVEQGQMVRLQPPRLVVLDSQHVRVLCDEDSHTTPVEYRITWIVPRPGGSIVRRQRIMREGLGWRIIDEEQTGNSSRWVVTGVSDWPFAWAPVFDTKNLPLANSYWGRPDLSGQMLDLVDAINGSASNGRRVSRLHGHPKVWATGIADETDLASGPEDALILPDDAQLGVLAPPSTVEQHLALWARLDTTLHKEGAFPEIAAGRLEGIGQLSGLALGILYGPLVRRVGQMRGLYGGLLSRVNLALLELAGYDPERTDPRWPDVVPTDELAQAQAAQAQQDAGVSRRTALEQAGYDPDLEAERRQLERETEPRQNLGAALQQFDAGQ